MVTKHGKEVAVVVDFASFERLTWENDDFKSYLTGGPSLDDLEIDRLAEVADVVELA